MYLRLEAIVAEMPDFISEPSPEALRWLGRANALLEMALPPQDLDRAGFKVASEGLIGLGRPSAANRIAVILHRALARAELAAPAAMQDTFVPVGATFTALQAISKIVRPATRDVLIVDPYLDESALLDYGPLIGEGVQLRLLYDSSGAKYSASLCVGVNRWTQQFGNSRPLETRASAPRALHDRLVIVDGSSVWSLTQSLKDFAGRSPASALKVRDEDIARLKVDAYSAIWATATPL